MSYHSSLTIVGNISPSPPFRGHSEITKPRYSISLFGAPSPLSPVYEGEIQVKGLGMAICAYDPSGKAILDGEPGDLVCTKPFPCQPVTFYGAEGEAKYKSSYFETFPGVWHHGECVCPPMILGGSRLLTFVLP